MQGDKRRAEARLPLDGGRSCLFDLKLCCLGSTSFIFALLFASDAWARFADGRTHESVSTLEYVILNGYVSAAVAILCFLIVIRSFGKCPSCCFYNHQERFLKQGSGAWPSLL